MQYQNHKDRECDKLLWGEELEYHILKVRSFLSKLHVMKQRSFSVPLPLIACDLRHVDRISGRSSRVVLIHYVHFLIFMYWKYHIVYVYVSYICTYVDEPVHGYAFCTRTNTRRHRDAHLRTHISTCRSYFHARKYQNVNTIFSN